MRRPTRHHELADSKAGFALILVLLVLALAGVVLAGSARRSCRQAVEAGRQTEQLQLRWGERSCRDLALTSARDLLIGEEARNYGPATQAYRQIDLGGMTFHMLLCDEQAKIEVNGLLADQGRPRAEAVIRELRPPSASQYQVRLRPGRLEGEGSDPTTAALATYDQLFAYKHPSALVEIDQGGGRQLAGRHVTCWSSGEVNFRRAPVSVLRRATAGVLSGRQLQALIAFRTDHPDGTLAEAIKYLQQLEELSMEGRPRELRPQRGTTHRRGTRKLARDVSSVLTGTSRCHSLWVVAEGSTRRWYSLHVAQEGSHPGGLAAWTFRW